MEQFAPFLFVLFAILVIVLAVVGFLQSARRKKELEAWAHANGFRFHPESDYSLDERYPDFSCLRQGSRRYGYHFVEGTRKGRNLRAFDYHYETYSSNSKGGRQTHHHYFSAVILRAPLPLKPLFIRPEGFFDKITEFLGFDDIDFESDEFSRTFYVKSPDKRWAFDVIHQETMEFLLAAPRFTMEFSNQDIIIYRAGTFTISDFENAIGVVEGILDRFPEYLLRELKGEN
ncbi:MAG: hypothetical protein C4527_20255 [Candidatus Omnitrophota bacterium]|nr:MAG: hypothetical protein C4527_20255 [Candidatus Omnitrophota bacterium]